MALITFTYTVIDGKNPAKKSKVTLYHPYDTLLTIENLQEIARDHLPIVRGIITGGIIDCSINIAPDMAPAFALDPTIKVPDPDSDVEEGAKFAFRPLDGDIRPTIMRIPTFNEDFLVSGTRIVDVDEPDVELFINAVVASVIPYPFDFGFSDSRGAPLTNFLGAEENFKRRKK